MNRLSPRINPINLSGRPFFAAITRRPRQSRKRTNFLNGAQAQLNGGPHRLPERIARLFAIHLSRSQEEEIIVMPHRVK
jgi:hypothetical protein